MPKKIIKSKTGHLASRLVPDAHFFGGEVGRGAVNYMLNQGYCNATCEHCYVNKSPVLEKGRRSIDEAKIDIRKLRKQGFKINLRGTEILLHPEYLELFPLASQDYIQTNGIQIAKNPALVKRMKGVGIKHLIFTHPMMDSYVVNYLADYVEKAIKLCKQHFSITVSYVLTKRVLSEPELLEDACKKAISMGANAAKFIRLIPLAPGLIERTLSTEESKRVLLMIKALKKKYKYEELVIQTPGCFGQFDFRRKLNKQKHQDVNLNRIYDCPAGVKNFVVDVDDKIYPCLYLMDKRHELGSWDQETFKITKNLPNHIGKLRCEECPAFTYHTSQNNLKGASND